MNPELAQELASKISDNLACKTTVDVLSPSNAVISCILKSGVKMLVLERKGKLVTKGDYGNLIRHIKDSDKAPMLYYDVDSAISNPDTFAKFVKYDCVKAIAPFYLSLVKRSEMVAEQFQDRIATARELAHCIKGNYDKTSGDVWKHDSRISFSAEVVDHDTVSMYVRTSPDMAARIAKILSEV